MIIHCFFTDPNLLAHSLLGLGVLDHILHGLENARQRLLARRHNLRRGQQEAVLALPSQGLDTRS